MACKTMSTPPPLPLKVLPRSAPRPAPVKPIQPACHLFGCFLTDYLARSKAFRGDSGLLGLSFLLTIPNVETPVIDGRYGAHAPQVPILHIIRCRLLGNTAPKHVHLFVCLFEGRKRGGNVKRVVIGSKSLHEKKNVSMRLLRSAQRIKVQPSTLM